jgi:hypothetical protein
VESGRTAIELTRDFPYTRWYMAWALIAMGNWEEAWNTAVEARSLGARQPLNEGQFGYVAGACRQETQARNVIRDLEERGHREHSSGLAIGWAYLGLGEKAACLDWLLYAFERGEPYLPSIAVSPACDTIRHQPEFLDLLKGMRCLTT